MQFHHHTLATHLQNALFEILHKLAAVVVVARVEGDERLAVDVVGQLDAMLVVWGRGAGLLWCPV